MLYAVAIGPLTQALLPLLRKSDAGRIVNLSSILGSLTLQADPNSPIYNAKFLGYDCSKAAVNMFTNHLAHELRGTKINVKRAWEANDKGIEAQVDEAVARVAHATTEHRGTVEQTIAATTAQVASLREEAERAVTDATRIERSAETLKELAAKGARVIILSHFGRPKGKRAPEFSLLPLVAPLEKALGRKVAFAEDCIGDAAAKVTSSPPAQARCTRSLAAS